MMHHIRIHKAEPNVGVWNFTHLLDAPAGKHGFVQARNGKLYFEDGTRARFLGFNVAARANTPDHETADKMAARFASMGVNIIRLHAADAPIGNMSCSWSSCREAPLIDYEKGNSRSFNPEGLDRFDYFAAKLKEKGIYLHIDLIVARAFLEGDGLDYPGGAASCGKRYPMYNARLIELQKEYAKALLCHVNPYTGLALIDDPAVATIQINNEESAIKGASDAPEAQPYKDEVQARFNHFLLMKYGARERLEAAWTHEGECALGEDEDPTRGAVRGVDGGFYQPVCDPMGDWTAEVSPARYADFMKFGIQMNREFYQMMIDYLHSLGAKVPIATSNLVCGAADVYGHSDADVMQNNTYFNHPMFPLGENGVYHTAGPTEYVSTNPLTYQRGIGAMATTLPGLASVAVVQGKPFMITEWNDYGLHPFRSTSFVHTVAYACLNDWDGLILYNHHTSEHWDDQPADEILNAFDAYNDPALICQWGFMATVFLKGLVSPAKRRVDVVYTKNDLDTLPNCHGMPACFFPYVTGMRNIFLDGGAHYNGDADVAVNAGFLNGADLTGAKHGVYYAWSPYRDAFRKYKDENRLALAAKGAQALAHGVCLSDKRLVFMDIADIAGLGDYRAFAACMDKAMKQWGVIPEGTGYVDGGLVSDTGEMTFQPEQSRFAIATKTCAYFSGAPEEIITLGSKVNIKCNNERISLSLMARDGGELSAAKELLLTAIGTTGMDETTCEPGPEMMGYRFNTVTLKGKLFAETLEGELRVRADTAVLEILNPVGEPLAAIEGVKDGADCVFVLKGDIPGVQYRLLLA